MCKFEQMIILPFLVDVYIFLKTFINLKKSLN